MKKLFIVHFNPVDKYPPAMNLVRYLDGAGDFQISLISSYYGKPDTDWFANCINLKVRYLAKDINKANRFNRVFQYFLFNIRTLWMLINQSPDAVLYYETISGWAPCIYKKYFKRNLRLLIHYHEYNTPEEYNNGMFLTKWLHQIEKGVYNKAFWISHTNDQRLSFFRRDVGLESASNLFVFPNYPPESWMKRAESSSMKSSFDKIAFVYVGALSLETMYTKEMALFVSTHPNECYWDIYSGTFDDEVKTFLSGLGAKNINFKGPVKYYELPEVLPKYDIGVILYKGTTDNFKYNAPNKLFEYMACGLNVWYPVEMEGIREYEERDASPWIRSERFDNLRMPAIGKTESSKDSFRNQYYSENQFSILQHHLKS